MLAKAFLGDRLREALAMDAKIFEEDFVELAMGDDFGGDDGKGETGIVVAGSSDSEDGGVRSVERVGSE